ncbi:MAG: HAMP domain-containing sensor histidine kinase [Gammaproteobacteria bacterium]|nr:HAMP domain-containing sensor histidine kinase [Burkholderiaceae bacterium]MDP2324954.1 HAMP domain-containing sensor histidine kinase [Gammaproteobacteria bacterium]
MLWRFPYRVQIPLGLSLAVLMTALLVTAVSAQISARSARLETLATLDRAVVLLVAQARPLLAADDTWRTFALLRDTAALIPGAATGHARLAVLDAEGHVFAASDPVQLDTGRPLLGTTWHDQPLQASREITGTQRLDQSDGAVILLDPIRSEDGQTLGHVFMEVDASVFAPDWPALAKTALIGMALAVTLLVPAGWWVGKRMTRPVARLVKVIERIGHDTPGNLRKEVPRTADPEMKRIGDAVLQLMGELEQREKAEARALSAERLAAVGRMTAVVAHEINNPLAGLLTATQTLRLHGDASDIRERTVDLLNRGLQQIRTTLAALLPQARREDRPLEPDDLDDVMTLVQATAGKHTAQLNTRIEVESALRVPSAPLRQVMLNLLLNALKAAGENGQIEALLKADAKKVQFSVFNTGAALTHEQFMESLAGESGLDPRGFGLWVCQELASHYRGGFELDRTTSSGTRLVFWLPNTEPQETKA